MINQETIVALATPNGLSAISVIRISGLNAISITEKLFKPKGNKKLSNQKSHTVHLGHLIRNGHELDEVLVTLFKGPHSYTGENTIEISCHGSTYIQQEIIDLFIENGIRVANPGEFTLRAFINGKMDLNQAEAVADLIASENEGSHKLAMEQMKNGFSNDLKKLRSELLHFSSMIELELDFSQEDVEFAERSEFKKLTIKIQSELEKLIDSFKSGNVLKNGISVAIAGKPNAGKSSLLNTLLNEDKAIVSDIPGTTRDSIEDCLVIDGINFRFTDTAGLRETKDLIESKGIEKTKEKINSARILIYLFDSNDTSFKEINSDLESFKREDLSILLVRNKVDLKNTNQILINELEKLEIIEISANNTESVSLLKKKLIDEINILNPYTDTVISNSRHYEALMNALKAIEEVNIGLKNDISGDLLSVDIRKSIEHLAEITGEITNDDVLGNIFANFCIGK
ncbi:tRNA uridine-5-carboxymethylaminomethyl(34) synthesis GTPase MnmE [Flavobacteriaceae bacterium]|nr:tRNA uridine-5-carboxymethylaminomethyl(34) synthesis GTPase MnmE [Flavobacteriaceae bacterium]MDA9257393.1 tRNA uridine-5-carboxymethylaminomethyl(34) synthesis GTPase MnmE [Flavobacteriaceae bacterium]MDB4131644.1 tRNA uridine-5-carboxymethylaminomethyl(34) synthesis GTPase MnmE [Flavobacteriaceae bacterium]MDC0106384.1 tRNA uridine-5-carboxymethylaminomethyl(34) synthesis GTPase MnmE [Flavobacteriaceae bacterium]